MIGITSPKNRKVGSFWGKSVSFFLIEAKFISKLLEKIRQQNGCQEIPRLRLLIMFKNSSFLIIKKTGVLNFKNSKSGHLRFPEFRNVRVSFFTKKRFPDLSREVLDSS